MVMIIFSALVRSHQSTSERVASFGPVRPACGYATRARPRLKIWMEGGAHPTYLPARGWGAVFPQIQYPICTPYNTYTIRARYNCDTCIGTPKFGIQRDTLQYIWIHICILMYPQNVIRILNLSQNDTRVISLLDAHFSTCLRCSIFTALSCEWIMNG